ncbi:hypothetical protein Agub_g5381 [Astrephomene gubernaculifera]|uniref:Uncharacterized protein n=1 Tax=Astrephomene gubernaculifera TaxID=47775 RepID=A0AAD3DP88_9CHLO|nr:hypothetical protein Agub_g5381 [Astrephomene gubernaculifera]
MSYIVADGSALGKACLFRRGMHMLASVAFRSPMCGALVHKSWTCYQDSDGPRNHILGGYFGNVSVIPLFREFVGMPMASYYPGSNSGSLFDSIDPSERVYSSGVVLYFYGGEAPGGACILWSSPPPSPSPPSPSPPSPSPPSPSPPSPSPPSPSPPSPSPPSPSPPSPSPPSPSPPPPPPPPRNQQTPPASPAALSPHTPPSSPSQPPPASPPPPSPVPPSPPTHPSPSPSPQTPPRSSLPPTSPSPLPSSPPSSPLPRTPPPTPSPTSPSPPPPSPPPTHPTKSLSPPPRRLRSPPPPSQPSPPPPAPMYWATSAFGPFDVNGTSTAPGSVSKLVGPPSSQVTDIKACRAALALGWVATIKNPRYVVASFNQTPAALVSQLAAVKLYVLSSGTLSPAISSIELLLRTPGAHNDTPQEVTMYAGGAQQSLKCAALNQFALVPDALQPRMTADALNTAEVVAVRIRANNQITNNKADLPVLAAVGLELRQ